MKSIVALIDGSGYAQSVCDHAGWVASRGGTDATLALCHVIRRHDIDAENTDLSGSIGLGARSSLLEELSELDEQKARLVNQRGRAILDDAKERAAEMGATNVTGMLRNGQLVETTEDLEKNADLIVIGKRGEASHLNMEHLGSNLERVVRSSSRPVMVASRAFQPINKVLIAFDGGASSTKAVQHIAGSAVFKGLEILCVQVGSEASRNPQPLADAVAILRDAGFAAESKLLPGQPESVIAGTVELEGIDLLVMGAYGHSRIRNLIIGSTTTQMVRACKVPIILYR